MKSKKFGVVFSLLVITSMVLAACGGGAAEVPQVTVNYNWLTEPPTADPALSTDTTSSKLIGSMFTGTTDIDLETNEAIPGLATSWSSNDAKDVWTFELRDDVPWVKYNAESGEVEVVEDENGDPRMVTAGDIAYAIRRALDPNTGSDYAYILYPIVGAEELNTADPAADNFDDLYDAVGVEAVDDTTLQVSLDFGAGFWPQVMSMPNFSAVPGWVIEEHGDQWVEPDNIVTNGAYAMEEWVHGDHLNLVRNSEWPMWGTDYAPGNITRLEGVMIEEASTAFNLYENNELDTIKPVPLEQIDRIQEELADEYVQAPENCTYYYGFVTTKAPVDDVRVRRALSMAIDRKTMVDEVLRGGQIPANTFTNALNFGHAAEDPDIAPWALTEDKDGTGYEAAVGMGQDLLAEAGFENGAGLDILLMHNVSEAHARIAQAVQAMWQEAYPDMTVTVETQEWQVYLDTIEATTAVEDVPHVYRLGWCADYPDANNWLLEVFHPEEGSNRTRLSADDPQVGDAVAEYMEVTKAAQTAPDAEAEDLYKQAEGLLIDDIAAIAPIYYYAVNGLQKPWLDRSFHEIQMHLFQWTLDQGAKQEALGG